MAEKNEEKKYVVGVDVGGQTTKIGVVDARGDVLAQTVIRSDTSAQTRTRISTRLRPPSKA